MKAFFDFSPIEIPYPEDSTVKEVYALFGLCSYYAQVIEQGFKLLAVVLHTKGYTKITSDVVEEAFNKQERKTLGRLIYDIKQQIEVSPELEDSLKSVLKKRNYLIHEFFYDHGVDFTTEAGRMKMLEELHTMTLLFQKIDSKVDDISHPLWRKIGVTDEMVNKHFKDIYAT